MTLAVAGARASGGSLRRAVLTFAILAVAVAGSMAVALLNGVWFDFVNGFVGATEAVPRGLLFSSWLLLLGGIAVARRPAAFGLRVGEIRRHLVLVAATIAAATAGTVVLLRLVGSTPYSDASLFIEAVDVPVTEELVFRAVLLTGLLFALGTLWPAKRAVPLAIVSDAIAFGAAHLANLTTDVSGFAIGQSVFAAVLGGLCGMLMVMTRSVYPAIALHGAVNAAVVLFS